MDDDAAAAERGRARSVEIVGRAGTLSYTTPDAFPNPDAERAGAARDLAVDDGSQEGVPATPFTVALPWNCAFEPTTTSQS